MEQTPHDNLVTWRRQILTLTRRGQSRALRRYMRTLWQGWARAYPCPTSSCSYARSTEPQAQSIAEALRGLGYGVWRDDEFPAHGPYAEVIEERLRGSKAVS